MKKPLKALLRAAVKTISLAGMLAAAFVFGWAVRGDLVYSDLFKKAMEHRHPAQSSAPAKRKKIYFIREDV